MTTAATTRIDPLAEAIAAASGWPEAVEAPVAEPAPRLTARSSPRNS